ncbi:MAG: CheR family methyltransferase [Phycisphaerae bacterium]
MNNYTVKLTEVEFKQMAKLIYDKTGIFLPESKLSLLSNRLRRRLRVLKLESFGDYYKLLCDDTQCKEELPFFLSAVTTNETYFFRNPNLWDYFRNTWIKSVATRKNKTIRIWSAASSSGEEAYTCAICLRECLPKASEWKISIVGTDISDNMLTKAREAVYNDYAVSKIEPSSLKRWFRQVDEEYHLRDEVKSMVNFQFHNLRDPMKGPQFDFVFLRNVLMYFDNPMKITVIRNVTNASKPGGIVFVGDVDPIRSTPELRDNVDLEYCGPNLYERPGVVSSAAGMQATEA